MQTTFKLTKQETLQKKVRGAKFDSKIIKYSIIFMCEGIKTPILDKHNKCLLKSKNMSILINYCFAVVFHLNVLKIFQSKTVVNSTLMMSNVMQQSTITIHPC